MDPKVIPAQILAHIAGRAWGVATTEEMLRAGLTSEQIKHRVRTGALIRVHRGVYRVGHAAPSVEARYLAAVKACGPGAALSGKAAAHLFRLTKGKAPPPEVTARSVKKVAGVRTRRAQRIARTTWRGIPVLTVPEVLLELAGTHSFDDLAYACHQAHALHHLRPDHVELRRVPGAAKLRAILHGDAPIVLSELERAFLRLLKAHDLPLPLTVELDSYRFHATRQAWENDRRRERQAYAREDDFRRYTYGDVTETPATIIRELQPLLTRDPGTMSSRPSGQRTHAL